MKKIFFIFSLSSITTSIVVFDSCVSLEKISEKSGAQLWAENCNRCHATPPPSEYNDSKWGIISVHMKIRANLADEETKKIVEFLKSVNISED